MNVVDWEQEVYNKVQEIKNAMSKFEEEEIFEELLNLIVDISAGTLDKGDNA